MHSTEIRALAVIIVASFLKPSMAETTNHPVKTAMNDGIYITGSIACLSLLDQTIRHHLADEKNSSFSRDFRQVGDYGQFAGPALGTLFAAHALITKNTVSQETALLAYEGFAWGSAMSGAIKFAVGRNRPEQTSNPFEFHFDRSNAGFPSGHTTVAFAAATVFAEQYPHWYVAVPAYAAAGAVGVSRLYANKHWLSDVAGGAVLGTLISHTLRNRHRKLKGGDWSFQLDPSEAKLTWAF